MKHFHWDLGDLPFVWRPLKAPSNEAFGLPDKLGFRLVLDPETGLLIQEKNEETLQALEKAYRSGSEMTGLMEPEGIGRSYADDFEAFILKGMGPDLSGSRILEIGCGTGYLLSRLKGRGAEVLGVEPGRHGQEGSSRYDVPILDEFFPSPNVQGDFQAVLLYAVLEYIQDFRGFLREMRRSVSPDTQVILSVPDSGPFIDAGDISVFLHEHWSYFTSETLTTTLAAAGGQNFEVVRAGFGAALYARFKFGEDTAQVGVSAGSAADGLSVARAFRERAEEVSWAVIARIRDVSGDGGAGIYVPGRVVNLLFSMGTDFSSLRFFGDDVALHGTYYPGVPVIVESREEFLRKTPGKVFVMSRTFGASLCDQLRKKIPSGVEVIPIGEIAPI